MNRENYVFIYLFASNNSVVSNKYAQYAGTGYTSPRTKKEIHELLGDEFLLRV